MDICSTFFDISKTKPIEIIAPTKAALINITELAGGKYIFGNLGDDGSRSSSVNMQMEEFYATAKDADYLIYNSTIDGELQTVDQLLGKCDLLKDFKAVKEGNVWCASGDFYQASMSLGTFISDVHQMLLYGKDASTVYIYPLA